MKNIIKLTESIELLANYGKQVWFTEFKTEPDFYKVLDAYRTVIVSARAYKTQMEVVADASENMATDLVAVYQNVASVTLDKMIDASIYLFKTVGTDETEGEDKLRRAMIMNRDAKAIYNRACELKNQ